MIVTMFLTFLKCHSAFHCGSPNDLNRLDLTIGHASANATMLPKAPGSQPSSSGGKDLVHVAWHTDSHSGMHMLHLSKESCRIALLSKDVQLIHDKPPCRGAGVGVAWWANNMLLLAVCDLPL